MVSQEFSGGSFGRAVVTVLAFSLIATACSGGDDAIVEPAPGTSAADTPSTAAEPPATSATTTSTTVPVMVESIDWSLCGDLECGAVEVPVDYDDPDGGTISIAVNMLRAADTDRRLGVLLVNPGGPGSSGLEFAELFAFGVFPTELTDNFDIIGFDPRGVGSSGPEFACGASGEQLEVLTSIEDLVDEPAEIAAAEAAVKLCEVSMGEAAGTLGTDFVVRDMDEIRKALGEEQISFLGYSYGSVIGVWYASLFPDRVRAMVIDGADNPVDELDTPEQRLESAKEQIGPLAELLGQALDACVETSCPIYNDGDPVEYYFEAVKKLDLVNAAMADNPVAGYLGLITPLYSEASWPTLWQALADLNERDDPALFVDLAEFQLGDDPGAANITAHVNCLDSWSLQPSIDRDVRQQSDAEFFELEDELNAEYPLLAAIEGSSTPICAFYDLINPEPLAVPFDGAGVPILVIGNRSDPVTSFGESEELAREILSNGILIDADHPTHTVYPSNPCVNEFVHDVLIDLDFPEDGTSCAPAEGDTRAILGDVCRDLAPAEAPDLGTSTIDSLCDRYVDEAVSRLGIQVIEDGLFTDDIDSGEALFALLLEVLASA